MSDHPFRVETWICHLRLFPDTGASAVVWSQPAPWQGSVGGVFLIYIPHVEWSISKEVRFCLRTCIFSRMRVHVVNGKGQLSRDVCSCLVTPHKLPGIPYGCMSRSAFFIDSAVSLIGFSAICGTAWKIWIGSSVPFPLSVRRPWLLSFWGLIFLYFDTRGRAKAEVFTPWQWVSNWYNNNPTQIIPV